LALTGLLLLAASVLIGSTAADLWVALAGMASLLLGAALLLPSVLRTLIGGLEKFVAPQKARLSWLLADSRWLLGPASLALMAMTLALVANSGLNTMINSFRGATDEWMNQRLAADLYLLAGQEVAGIEAWLSGEMPELTIAKRYGKRVTRLNPADKSVIVGVFSLQGGDRFRDSVKLMRGDQNAAARFENSEGIYISERAWRLDGWQTGELINLCEDHPKVPILGIYRDYGNPISQWLVSRQLFGQCWPDEVAMGLSVYGPEGSDWDQIRLVIADRFELEENQLIDQNVIKEVGLAVFDRTFAVTRSLNTLTLLVAAIGIFCAISAIHHHRVGQQALLASLGMTRRERGSLLLLQWGMIGLLCMALVWPFGTILAGYLAAVVTPVAFGWSFPLKLEWQHYLVLVALAAGCLMIAVVLPSLRLLHTSPAAMLREQNV
jgi:putative ABC transport system permease protein